MDNTGVSPTGTVDFQEWMDELSEKIERVAKLFPRNSATPEPADYQPDIEFCPHDSYFCPFPKCRLGFQCKEMKLVHEIMAHKVPDTVKRDALKAMKAKIKDSSGRIPTEEHSCCDKPKKPCRFECEYCPAVSLRSQ